MQSNVQDHLAAFDRWLTGRIEEAYGACKDLAFRDRLADAHGPGEVWEYSLLEPGCAAPHGEGWSVYRLQGVWPEFRNAQPEPARAPAPPRPSFWARLAGTLLERPGR